MRRAFTQIILRTAAEYWEVLEFSSNIEDVCGLPREALEAYRENFLKLILPEERMRVSNELLGKLRTSGFGNCIARLEPAMGQMPVCLTIMQPFDTQSSFLISISLADSLARGLGGADGALCLLEDSMPGGICRFYDDSELTVLHCNNVFLEQIGYTRDQFASEMHMHLADCIHEQDFAHLRSLLESEPFQKTRSVDLRILHRSGQERTLIATMLWIKGAYPGRRQFYCSLIDITEYKRGQSTSLFFGQMDLDDGIMLQLNTLSEVARGLLERHDCRKLLEEIACQYVRAGDRERFLNAFDASRLRLLFSRKICEANIDCEFKDGQGGWRWTRFSTHCFNEQRSNHLCAYIYIQDIHEGKQKELELHARSQQDQMTKLYNRLTSEFKINEQLEEDQRNGRMSALIMMDLDNFKQINDTRGHATGDEALRLVASALRSQLPENAVIGRLGGDEFVALLPAIASRLEVEGCAQELCGALRMLLCVYGSSASIGVAMAPADGQNFSELYPRADTALYQSKRRGRGNYSFYDPNMESLKRRTACNPLGREWLLDETSDLVYVADFYTYDMLYMNKTARAAFNIRTDADYIGRKCYEVMQGAQEPCPFCTNSLLCRENFYIWDFYNPRLRRYFIVKDRIVDWYGAPARIEFETDITRKEEQTRKLEKQVNLEKFAIECMRSLFDTVSMEEAARYLLRHIGMFFRAKHAYITQYDPSAGMQFVTYEWFSSSAGFGPQDFHDPALYNHEQFMRCFVTGNAYTLDMTEDMEDESPQLYALLSDRQIRCRRAVVFRADSVPTGMIGLDDPRVFQNEMGVLDILGRCIADRMAKFRLTDLLASLGYPAI